MCGRFTNGFTWAELHALYSLSDGLFPMIPPLHVQPKFNIAPVEDADFVAYNKGGARQLLTGRCDLYPNGLRNRRRRLCCSTRGSTQSTAPPPCGMPSQCADASCLPTATLYMPTRGSKGGSGMEDLKPPAGPLIDDTRSARNAVLPRRFLVPCRAGWGCCRMRGGPSTEALTTSGVSPRHLGDDNRRQQGLSKERCMLIVDMQRHLWPRCSAS